MPERKYVIFACVSLALLMSSIDSTVVAVALQAIRKDFNAGILWSGWTVTAYQLGQLLVMPIAGKMSDEFGRKRVFLAAVVIFTGSSLLCGFAPNVYLLVLFRVLQAVGGGAFLPSCTGIVADEFKEHRAQAIGLFASIFPIGGILGPNIGGFLVDNFSWRFVFFINVPLGIVVLVSTGLLYRRRETEGSRTIDFIGAALYGSAIITALAGLTWLGEDPGSTGNPLLWSAFVVSAALLVAFYRWEHRVAEPVIDPILLKHRPFLAANLYNLLFGASVFGFSAFVPTYIQLRYGTDASVAGALLTPRALAMIATSTVASLYIIRLGYRMPMIAGLLLQTVNLFLLSRGFQHVSLLGFHLSDVAWLGFVMSISGFGFGISQPAANNAALDLLPGKVAAVTGIRSMFRLTRGIIGTALIVLVLTHYQTNEATGLEHIFLALAGINLLIMPIRFLIPDLARERRQTALATAAEQRLAGEQLRLADVAAAE
ncbi:MAG: DHA2 family efflux MFS transporter permease subunit [Dehalococcoidia bacterium]